MSTIESFDAFGARIRDPKRVKDAKYHLARAKRAYYHELARRSAVTRSARAAKRSKKLAHAVGEVHVPIIGRWAEKATP